MTDKFIKLGDLLSKESADLVFPSTERFTAIKQNSNNSIIEVRREMFLKDVRDQETMPPTSAALLEHAFCSAYIAGHRWNNQRRIYNFCNIQDGALCENS